MSVDPTNDLEFRLVDLQHTVAALQARIDHLERRGGRRWPAAACVLLGALAFGWHPSAQTTGQTVKAPFVVTDDGGKPILRVQAPGGPDGGTRGVTVLDEAGKVVVGGFANPGGGTLVAYGANGAVNQSIGFTHDQDGSATLLALGGDGKPRLKYSKEGLVAAAPVSILDASGKKLVDMVEGGPGGGVRGLNVFNGAGKAIVSAFAVVGGGGGGLVAHGAAGTSSNSIGFTHDGDAPSFMVLGADMSRPLLKFTEADGLRLRGPVEVVDETDARVARLGPAGSDAVRGLVIADGGKTRIALGPGDKGGYQLNVSNANGANVAGLGEAGIGGGVAWTSSGTGTIRAIVSGTGQIHVANSGGTTLATMVAEETSGALSVRNPAGTTIARLGEGLRGGLLQLAEAGGNAIVEAGVLPSGEGVVRAYPLGSPGVGLVGMPGTFIMGRGPRK